MLCACLALSMAACQDRLAEPAAPDPEQEGVAELRLDVGSPASAWVEPGTRALGSEALTKMAESNDLNSLLMLVVKHKPSPDGSDRNCRVVAYRLLVRKHRAKADDPVIKEGDKYLFYNNNNNNNNNFDFNVHGQVKWPHLRLGAIGGHHIVPATEDEPGAYFVESEGWVRGVDDSEILTIPETGGVALEGRNEWRGKDAAGEKETLAYLHFRHFYPLHGTFERPTPGDYSIACLANFTDADDKIVVPYPDNQQYPSQAQVTIDAPRLDGSGTVPLTLPVLVNPGMPIGYHVREILAYWQRHQDDPDFDGVPMHPCYDEGACGPVGGYPDNPVDGYGGGLEETDWFVGARNLIQGRIVYDDAHVTIGPAGRDEMGFRCASATDQVTSDAYLWNSTETQVFSKYFNITLKPGENDLERISMDRITARTTISLHNLSEKTMRVTSLELSNNYAQAATTLFMGTGGDHHFGNAEGYSPNWRGKPDLRSHRAIVPFKPGSAALAQDEAWASTEERERVIFDGLTFAARDEERPMRCTLQVAIDGVRGEAYQIDTTPTSLPTLLEALGDPDWVDGTSRQFLMQSQFASGTYSYAFVRGRIDAEPWGDSSKKNISAFSSESLADEDELFVWDLEKVDATHVRIKVSKTGEYLRTTQYKTGYGDTWQRTMTKADASVFSLHNNPPYEGVYFKKAIVPQLAGTTFSIGLDQGSANAHFAAYRVSPSGSSISGTNYKYEAGNRLTLDQIQALLSAAPVGDKIYLLLQGSSGSFLRANGSNTPYGASLSGFSENKALTITSSTNRNFVWALEKVNAASNLVYLYSAKENKYIALKNESNWKLNTSDKTSFAVKSFIGGDGTSIAFDSETAIYAYMYGNNDGNTGKMSAVGYWNDAGSHFKLYEVEEIEGEALTLSKEFDFDIKRMKLTDGQPHTLHSYKRGDHLNLIISVDYNPLSSQITFGVTDWQTRDNEIVFD